MPDESSAREARHVTNRGYGPDEPRATRPTMPEGYGVPEGDEGMVPWRFVTERLERALSYWVCTTRPDGRPHAMPIWGGWVDGTLYVEGSPQTRRGRNLAANPSVVVHLESADEVVIIEETAEEIGMPEPSLAKRIAEAFGAKYASYNYRPTPDQWNEGGLYAVRPRTVFAWSEFPRTATRFLFDGS